MAYSDYKDLDVWKTAMDLTCEIYKLIKKLPKEENFALAEQMRRSAVSVPSNIAEGRGRQTDADFRHFLYIAKGSCHELETQLMICIRLDYLTASDCEEVLDNTDKVGRMLSNLIRTLSR